MANKINNIELAEFAGNQLGSAYIWGGLGKTITEALIQQMAALYPKVYTEEYKAKVRKNMGSKSYDCVGLIKCAMWGNKGDGLLRIYDASTDITANDMLDNCPVQGSISAMPEIPGLIVWMPGHIGIYIGGGQVVEARGVDYGVVQTVLAGRGWQKWGQCKWVDYVTQTDFVHVETYPLSDYTFGIHRASLSPSAAPLGKVRAWADAVYAQNKDLEGVINASPFDGTNPIGTVIEDGKVVANAGNGWGFGIDKNGNVHFDRIFKDLDNIDWQDMISAHPVLIYRGAPQNIDTSVTLFKDRQPRSAVALRGEEILFVTVDGLQTGRPGMTLVELRDYLKNIGCTEAINLDGGGIQLRDRSGTGSFEAINRPTEYRDVYNVISAYRRPKDIPPKPPTPPVGKSITWEQLAARLRAEGIEKITL